MIIKIGLCLTLTSIKFTFACQSPAKNVNPLKASSVEEDDTLTSCDVRYRAIVNWSPPNAIGPNTFLPSVILYGT